MNWYKLAKESNSQGWILPNNNIVYVDYMEHYQFILDNYKLFNIDKKSIDIIFKEQKEKEANFLPDSIDMMYLAFKNGAVRFSYLDFINKIFSINGFRNAIKSKASILHSIVNRFGFNGTLEVQIEYPNETNTINTSSEFKTISVEDLYTL